MQRFHPAVQAWFRSELGAPTSCQERAWAAIAGGADTLVAAPTGSGKTLAAFLSAIDDLVRESLLGPLPDECRVLYVSPLKALSNDIQRNLERPLAGIAARIAGQRQGHIRQGGRTGARTTPRDDLGIRAMVRTGDTPRPARDAMRRTPPHILVTTPESLFILLTSEGGRRILATVRTVIVDEIHAIAGNKRGAHLGLSLERLARLTGAPPVRIGLSATQKPVQRMARFLSGGACALSRPCAIVDIGHTRARDLALELPDQPLQSLMSGEAWQEVYDRLVQLIETHRTTLIFVNTRRLAERLAHALTQRLGEDHVTSHHGSLAREQRLDAEQRLKRGELKALVATASLELGIDIGDVDLVCQIGVPGSIATFLQRVGRAGHAVGGTSKGRLFPLTRDDLVSCTALLEAVRLGELDALHVPHAPLDVLCQQVVAMAAAEPWQEADMYRCVRQAYAYRELDEEHFRDCLRMLAEGFATRRGRRGAYLHRDTVNGQIRARRNARLVAMTNGGAIPDNADFDVWLEPDGIRIGTLNEDFAIESVPGDVFLLGNTPWRVLRIEEGKVRVEDARGLAPNIPFWFGEAPGRSDELSQAVSRLRRRLQRMLTPRDGEDGVSLRARAASSLAQEPGLGRAAAEQLVDYLAAALAALGTLPDQDTVVLERFFDDSGGMQLVVHACCGSRINKAWGLALRKRFCRSFNFELQAAANEDTIVLSLGETHSFPLADAARFVSAASARDTLTQALLDAPVFEVRWRWNANISLAVPRFRSGRKVPPQIQRMQAEDLVAVAFPDQIACLENLSGPRQIPDHPLVNQTVHDALTEAMDIDGLEALLHRLEAGSLSVHAVDVTEPSPLAAEILVANPYAFLDDAPAEERRTRAVRSRRHHDPDQAAALSRLDAGSIREVEAQLRTPPRDVDELHDSLLLLGCVRRSGLTAPRAGEWAEQWIDQLVAQRRAVRARVAPCHGGNEVEFVVAAQRLQQFRCLHPGARVFGEAVTPAEDWRDDLERDTAVLEMVRARMQDSGPIAVDTLAGYLCLHEDEILLALALLESEGVVLRGHFLDTPGNTLQWCERRILARIHRHGVHRKRAGVSAVNAAAYMRFLFRWQHLEAEQRRHGEAGLRQALERLQGAAVPAQSWESEVLPARVVDFQPAWLDHLCLAGEASWMRAHPGAEDARGERRFRPLRRTPVMLLRRDNMDLWSRAASRVEPPRGLQTRVLEALETRGASFFDELVQATGDSVHAVEQALAELSAMGLVVSDGFAGLRALMRRRVRGRSRRGEAAAPSPFAQAGRWSRMVPETWPAEPDRARLRELQRAQRQAAILLCRFGVVFKALLGRETGLPPWRDLLTCLRQMEARGEVRGGRFVEGFSGEQFALPDAAEQLARQAHTGNEGQLVAISGCDPANLTGLVTPGERVPGRSGQVVAYRDGVPVAHRSGEQFLPLTDLAPGEEWAVRALLFGARTPAPPTRDLLAFVPVQPSTPQH
jgi:ATP-dependent Lhr-like helicase